MTADVSKTKEQLITELANLRKDCDKLHSLFKMIPVGLLVADETGKIVMSNAVIKSIFGDAGASAHGPWGSYSVYHLDGSVFLPEHLPLTKSLKSKQSFNGVNMLVYRKDEVVITTVASSPVYNKKGHFIGAVAVIDDITKKAKLQQEKDIFFKQMSTQQQLLQQVQSQTDAILDALPVGVFIADKNGKFIKTNKLVDDIWGGKVPHCKEIAEYHQYQGWWSNTGERLKTEDWGLARALNGEVSKGEVIDILRYDGTKNTILNFAAPIRDGKGNVTGAVEVAQDITYQRELENELRQHQIHLEKLVQLRTDELKATEFRFRMLFETSPVGLAFVTTKRKIIDANPAFENFLGYSHGELIDFNFTDITYPEDIAADLELTNKILQGEIADYQLERRYLRKDGEIVWGNLLVAASFKLENNLQFLIAIVEDITERKKHEQEMARLDRLNIVGQMAAGISHEVRNPMTTVRGFLQMLGSKKEYQQDKGFFNLMISELDRANSIMTEFLSIGKDTPSELKLQSLNTIIETLAPLLQVDALGVNKYLELKLEKTPVLLLNGEELRQVILNLVRNGLEATEPNGKITISTKLVADKVVLEVSDQGSGIPANVLHNLGTPFFTTKENGTGLGLATCYSIVKRHNGKIDVDTSDNGTRFSVSFPV